MPASQLRGLRGEDRGDMEATSPSRESQAEMSKMPEEEERGLKKRGVMQCREVALRTFVTTGIM